MTVKEKLHQIINEIEDENVLSAYLQLLQTNTPSRSS